MSEMVYDIRTGSMIRLDIPEITVTDLDAAYLALDKMINDVRGGVQSDIDNLYQYVGDLVRDHQSAIVILAVALARLANR